MFYEKKIYSYVVSIVKSDYSKITISHSSANDVLTIYSSTIRSSFTVKSTNTFKKKSWYILYSSKLYIKFDPIVGNCVLYVHSVYLHVEVLVLKKSSDQWQPYLMSQTWQLNKTGKAC